MLFSFLIAFAGLLLSGYFAIGCIGKKKSNDAYDNSQAISGKVVKTTCTTVTTAPTVNSAPIELPQPPPVLKATLDATVTPNMPEEQITGQSQYGIKEAKRSPATYEDRFTGISQYGVKEVQNEHKFVDQKEHDTLSGYNPVAKEVKRSAEIRSSKKVPKGKVEYKTIQSGTSDFDATLSQCPASQQVLSTYAFSKKPER